MKLLHLATNHRTHFHVVLMIDLCGSHFSEHLILSKKSVRSNYFKRIEINEISKAIFCVIAEFLSGSTHSENSIEKRRILLVRWRLDLKLRKLFVRHGDLSVRKLAHSHTRQLRY